MIYLSIVKQLDHYKWFFFLRGQPSPPLIGNNNNNNNIFALPNIGLLQIILTWLSMLEYKPKIMSTAPFTRPISMLSSIKWQIHPAIPWNHKNPSQTSSLLIFCQIHLYRQILCGSGQCLWAEWSQNIFQPSKSSERMWFFTFHTSMLKKWHKNLKRYVH